MKDGETNPTGTYLDMAANLPLVDPKKVLSPVLMVRGIADTNSSNDDLLDFYRQLPNGDRQFVILPNTAHSVGYSKNRHLLWYVMRNFLAAPVTPEAPLDVIMAMAKIPSSWPSPSGVFVACARNSVASVI